ncbi:class I SAM-dependent methyltransferase [Caldithrix abyssi]
MSKDYADVDYASLTTGDRNPVKRYLQKRRLKHSLLALQSTDQNFSGAILDFGAGNGELCKRISLRLPHCKIVCYEPSANLRRQAVENTQNFPNITVIGNLKDSPVADFDFIFCLEVFEHLPDQPMEAALNDLRALLKKEGKLIIGVPNELYLPALLKGSLRLMRRYGEVDARPLNILKAFAGQPPKSREIVAFDGLPYFLRHMGFDYRTFQKKILNHFQIKRSYGSPLPFFPIGLNFEVYFICQHKAE